METEVTVTLEERVRDLVEARAGQPGPLLEVLHDVQAELGWIDPAAVPVIADALNLSRAEVHGVVTFYKDLRRSPPAPTTVQVCRAEACQANGSEALVAHAEQRLGVAVGERTADGTVDLQEVFCLGLCGIGPSVRLGDQVVAHVDPAHLDALLDGELARPTRRAGQRVLGETWTVFVPGDAAAGSLGADEVADAIALEVEARALDVRIVRNGSRGMHWLEPLVEVAGADGVRHAYGPVAISDVGAVLDHAVGHSGATALALGPTEELPWLRDQTRLTFARVGVVDPRSADDFLAQGGMAGLQVALGLPSAEVVAQVTASGLRGRGGAGFPTGVKWQTVLDTQSEVKFICANADEGDSGTFADRMLLEGDPFTLLEGMAIAGHAVGATEGFVYVRSEYPDAIAVLRDAIEIAYSRGWLGERILGSDVRFEVTLRVGAGAYICGEETSMLNSLEGRRGEVRAKPPLPAIEGLFGRPTVVNNVLSLATVPWVLAHGAETYAALGHDRSTGTQVVQLAGNVARSGIVETPFGISLGDLVHTWGGGTRSGRPIGAVQVGGPLGAYLPPDALDLPYDYEAFAAAGAMVGHGGIVVFDDTFDAAAQARFAMRFCAEESCGKCTPCRVGSVRGVEVLDRIIAGKDRSANLVLLEDLCEVLADGSLCAMGGLTPSPVRSAVRHFPDHFDREASDAAAP
ncbi:MAG: NAD(P)H-dependent oxidoreductase subunit E [Acidimicrobiales bacterium]